MSAMRAISVSTKPAARSAPTCSTPTCGSARNSWSISPGSPTGTGTSPRLLKLQAGKADAFLGAGHEVHFVYYAPSEHTQQMARMVLRSWDDVPGVIPLLAETEADALQVLGQPEQTIDAMLQTV
ncbi:MAG: hypothetical protein R3D59_15245 [Paracoccaceae bacterium]